MLVHSHTTVIQHAYGMLILAMALCGTLFKIIACHLKSLPTRDHYILLVCVCVCVRGCVYVRTCVHRCLHVCMHACECLKQIHLSPFELTMFVEYEAHCSYSIEKYNGSNCTFIGNNYNLAQLVHKPNTFLS